MTTLPELTNATLAGREPEWTKAWWFGRMDEAVSLILLLIRKKFGPPPDWVQDQLMNATLDQMEAWCERLLDAESLEELFQ